MYRLILCEKPSVSAIVAHAVGARERIFDDNNKNFCYSGNGYYVANARGHLYGVGLPQDYGYSKNYKLEELPMFPDFKVMPEGEDTESLRRFISSLIDRDDVSEIICATDAGREGELIFRHIYNANHCTKPVKRLWCNSMTDEAINKCLADLPDDSKFDGLYQAALAREYSDWLIGMNLSRLYGIKDDHPHRVGRVKTPVLAIIAERDKQIKAHQKTVNYRIELDNGAVSENTYNTREECEKALQSISGRNAVVIKVEETEKKRNRPKLFSLSGLQQEANNVYGFTAKHTLELAQALYEKKLLTYPRTDCECISDDMEHKFRHTVESIGSRPEYTDRVRILSAQGLNIDKRVMNTAVMAEHDHHAIIPEDNAGKLDTLSEDERKLYELVVNRALCVVDKQYSYREKNYTMECGGIRFTLKAVIPIEQGWKKYDTDHHDKCSSLDIRQGTSFSANGKVRECVSQPPNAYTDSTLISVMNNIDNRIESEELKSAVRGKGIGTEATRAEIIEQLIAAGYIYREGKTIKVTDFGMAFADSLPDSVKSVERTAQWEQDLERIRNGELDSKAFLDEMKRFISDTIAFENSPTRQRTSLKSDKPGSERVSLGECPRCGKNIYEGKANFYCESGKNGCGFTIWKEQKIYRDVITAEMVKRLLDGKSVSLKATTREGAIYTADFTLDDTGKYVNFKRVVKPKLRIGECPRCHSAVIEGKQNYYCEAGRDRCGFTLWKHDSYNNITVTPEDAAKLLMGQTITKATDGSAENTYRMVDTGTYVNLREV